MKKTLKHITVIISIAAVISVAACSKKDASQPTTPAQNTVVNHLNDFRDSLVGTYQCTDSHHVSTPPNNITVVGFGSGPIPVTFPPTDDSSVIINGTPYFFVSSDSVQTTFSVPSVNSVSYAYFGKHNDSIWYQYISRYSMIEIDYDFFTGHKN